MPQLIEMDSAVPFHEQLSDEANEKVTLVNIFHVPADEIDMFVKNWVKSAQALEGKPGFISTQLHRGIAGSNTFMNYAIWASVAAYKAAIQSPDVQKVLVFGEQQKQSGRGTASPHLFREVAREAAQEG